MTEVDRDIALVLLKRLWKRELISEETYVSACNSRFFDKCRFTSDTEAMEEIKCKAVELADKYLPVCSTAFWLESERSVHNGDGGGDT